jgi:hypothetical protein
MPTVATLSFQSLSVTSSAVKSWQHCNPANRFGRRELADVRFWVSLASYSCSLAAFANGNCPLPYRTYKFPPLCLFDGSAPLHRNLPVNCYLTVLAFPGLKRLLKYLGEHLSGFRGDLPHTVVEGRGHLRGEMHCAAGAA